MKRYIIVLMTGLSVMACGERKPSRTSASANDKEEEKTALKKSDSSLKPDESALGKVPDESVNTQSNVRISESIMKLCGIDAVEARFAFDSSKVNDGSVVGLDKLVSCFSSGAAKGRVLKLVGRADARGTAEYNNVLGQARADSVASYLNKKGLAKSQTSTTTRGASDATGTDEEGYAKDRRVDLLLDSELGSK